MSACCSSCSNSFCESGLRRWPGSGVFSAQSLARKCGVSAPADLGSGLPREPNELGRIWLVHTGVVCASIESGFDASLLVDDKSMGLSTIGSSTSKSEDAGCCCDHPTDIRAGVSASCMAFASGPPVERRALDPQLLAEVLLAGVERAASIVRQRFMMPPTFEGRLMRETPAGAARDAGCPAGAFHCSCCAWAGRACVHDRNFSRACSSPAAASQRGGVSQLVAPHAVLGAASSNTAHTHTPANNPCCPPIVCRVRPSRRAAQKDSRQHGDKNTRARALHAAASRQHGDQNTRVRALHAVHSP